MRLLIAGGRLSGCGYSTFSVCRWTRGLSHPRLKTVDYSPHPASTVAISVRPAAMLFGPPSTTNADASAALCGSVLEQIGSLTGPLTQPLTISVSITA